MEITNDFSMRHKQLSSMDSLRISYCLTMSYIASPSIATSTFGCRPTPNRQWRNSTSRNQAWGLQCRWRVWVYCRNSWEFVSQKRKRKTLRRNDLIYMRHPCLIPIVQSIDPSLLMPVMRHRHSICITDTVLPFSIVLQYMQALTASLHRAQQTLIARHHQSVQTLLSALTNDSSPQQFKPEDAPLNKQEERVLQIDVIESSYIPLTEENIPEPPKHDPPIQEEAHSHKEKRKLQSIQNEKRAILDQLRRIDEEIAVIKGEPAEDVNLKRKQKEAEDERARKQAQQLVKQLKKEKRGLQERKRQDQQKKLQSLKQEEEQVRQRRREGEERAKEERRKAIEQRMEQERRKRDERKLMDKESNRLLVQLRREDELMKAKEVIPVQTNELQQKKRVVQKRQDVNFRDIQEHERRYIIMKEQQKLNRRDRSESQSHPVPKYQKNTWIEKIEEEDSKKREEEKIKDLQRKNQLQKRLKYGQLVKNIFLPKKRQDKPGPIEDPPKPHTPNAPSLPKIPQSEKRVTQGKGNKHFAENNRPFATAHNYKKPPRAPKIQLAVEEPVIEDEGAVEKERERKQRELQLRRETKERLRKLQNQSLDLLPQSKPKYQNYLGQVKQKRKEETWKDIIDNGKLSKEQKYTEMLKQANSLQTRAKQKEEFRKQGDEEAVNLYINSIQAKLALLEKF